MTPQSFYSMVLDHSAGAVWSATFDCAEDALEHLTRVFAHEGFATWLASLRRIMAQPRPT